MDRCGHAMTPNLLWLAGVAGDGFERRMLEEPSAELSADETRQALLHAALAHLHEHRGHRANAAKAALRHAAKAVAAESSCVGRALPEDETVLILEALDPVVRRYAESGLPLEPVMAHDLTLSCTLGRFRFETRVPLLLATPQRMVWWRAGARPEAGSATDARHRFTMGVAGVLGEEAFGADARELVTLYPEADERTVEAFDDILSSETRLDMLEWARLAEERLDALAGAAATAFLA